MEKFENFKKYLEYYRQQLLVEEALGAVGITLDPSKSLLFYMDSLISWVPDLIMNHPEIFWEELDTNMLTEDEEAFNEYVEELWKNIQQ